MKQKHRNIIAKITVIVMALSFLLAPIPGAHAAQIITFSDTMSRLKAATASNHTMLFAIPGGIAAGNVITLTMTGFDATSVDNILFSDVDFATGNNTCSASPTFTEQTLAASAVTTTWGIASDASNHITITSGTGTSTATYCVRVKIGTNASNQTTGVNEITNGAAATAHSVTAAVNNTGSDTATAAIDVITDDQVSITATVDPTITFTIDDNAVGFGTLSSSQARWANAAATGTNAAASLPTAANVLTVATNAASGYTLTYLGATLTATVGTITAATITGDSDGTAGTEQFALTISTSGDATIASGYQRGTNSDWNFVPATTTTIASETVPTNTETFSISYLANIGGATEAGAYSTTLTYIATGSF
jgi:hypothetical protein